MIIPCNCKKCGRTSFVTIDEDSCVSCFMEQHLKPLPKPSRAREGKRLSYFCLFMMPITLLIGLTLGFLPEATFLAGILWGIVMIPAVDFLMRKF